MEQGKYFCQQPPRLGNQYLEDTALRELLSRLLPKSILEEINDDLTRFGARVLGDIQEYGREAESHPPTLTHYNAWGKRIDEVRVANGWKELQKISAEEGLVNIAYERKQGQFSRVYQFAKLYLFSPSSYTFNCPLAMADGAARLLEVWTKDDSVPELREAFDHLTSRDPSKFWTSGQWMTEKPGGSDVGNTETIAIPSNRRSDGRDYLLSGYKFFTSASTSEMSILLARTKDANGNSIAGSRGLSAFFVRTHNDQGQLNNMIVHRLKNKLGTKALPTAELELINMPGILIGPLQKGVPVISTLFNLTRIFNAIGSVSSMRRGLALARDYCHRRETFGKLLCEHPLHLQTLATLEVQFRAALQLSFECVLLMGKIETGCASNEEMILLRILTPLAKLFTAKQAVACASEIVESFGGIGYMEDSDIPRILRDIQVNSIWEGTTNVLSLDVWRPMRSSNAFSVFAKTVRIKLSKKSNDNVILQICSAEIENSLQSLEHYYHGRLEKAEQSEVECIARQWAFSMSRVYVGSLLVEHACWSRSAIDAEVSRRWCFEESLLQLPGNHMIPSLAKNVLPIPIPIPIPRAPKGDMLFGDGLYRELTRQLALDLDNFGKPRGCGDAHSDGTPRAKY